MEDIEKILKMIEQGDTVLLLAEISLKESLDELFKHGIVEVLDDKLVVTERGLEVRAKGIEKVLEESRAHEKLETFQKKPGKKWNILRFVLFN